LGTSTHLVPSRIVSPRVVRWALGAAGESPARATNGTWIALAFRDLAFLADSLREKIDGGPPPGFGGMLDADPAALPDNRLQRSSRTGGRE
jgi:hypothetical protein